MDGSLVEISGLGVLAEAAWTSNWLEFESGCSELLEVVTPEGNFEELLASRVPMSPILCDSLIERSSEVNDDVVFADDPKVIPFDESGVKLDGGGGVPNGPVTRALTAGNDCESLLVAVVITR